MQEISNQFEKNISIKEITANESIRELAQLLESKSTLDSYEKQSDYKLLKNQEGILVECLAKPESTMYNIPLLLKLSSDIQLDALKEAVVTAFHAHPYLNTRFYTSEDGDMKQKRDDSFDFSADDIETLSFEEKLPEEGSLVKPFQVMDSRLFRVSIIKTAEANYLLMDIHHLIFDGTSSSILISDISKAYLGEKLETEVFTSYEAVLKEEADRNTPSYTDAKNYFENLLEDAEIDVLPEKDQLSIEVSGSKTLTVNSTYTLPESVRAFCDTHNTTENALFSAAFGYTLARFSNVSDATFASIYHGRNDVRLGNAIGMFVRTFPVRLKIEEANQKAPISKLVADMGSQLMASMSNDVYSYAEICECMDGQPDVLFAYQGDRLEVDSFCGAPVELKQLPIDADKQALTINVYARGEGYVMTADYDTSLYTEELIRNFLDEYDHILTEFIKKDSLNQIEICSSKAKKVIESFATTESAPALPATLPEVILKEAEAHPEKTAIVFKEKKVSYGDMVQLSKRIAWKLHSLGLEKEDFVSILINRTEWMPIVSLGVMISGAAYQPLDSTYPTERLNFMMKDANAKLLIADRDLRDLVGEYDGPVLYIDEVETLPLPSEDELKEIQAPSPSDAMIILYTSGTTGIPKGCILEHHNLMNFIPFYSKKMKINQASKCLAYASFGFDMEPKRKLHQATW